MSSNSDIRSRLGCLPNELLLNIAAYLPTQHLSALARCNHRLLRVLNNEAYKSDPQQNTALRWGAVRGVPETVSRSFEAGANIEGPEVADALILAAEYGHWSVLQVILDQGVAVNSATATNALIWAARYGREPMVQLCLDRGIDGNRITEGGTALIRASEYGHVDVVKLLLRHGVDINLKAQGGTPILWAASYGHDSVVRLLLEAGASVKDGNSHVDSPLIWAVSKGHEKIVEMLVEAGANIENKGRAGMEGTPLILAIQHGYAAVVEVLLQKGAETESADSKLGQTPLSWTAVLGNEAMAKSLLHHGASVESNCRDVPTPLMLAALIGSLGVARLLVEYGAGVLAKDSDGHTALAWAFRRGDNGIEPEGREKVIRLLVEHGAAAGPQERELAKHWATCNGISDLL